MPEHNSGVCEKCRKVVPVTHDLRKDGVYIVKDCPDCGTTEALVSSDAETWQRKRDIFDYKPDEASHSCRLTCLGCGHLHHPRMVFLNVTNRCNMNCPICIANIPGMGFEFHPPLEYFERVLDGLAKFDPKPTVNLFGGEPTVRKDMFEIIRMTRDKGLRVGIVTNGLRLADEDYCKKVCESGARILLGFDGRDPEIYNRLRKNPSAYAKKLKAFENLKKHSTRKHTIMACVARKINDRHMRDLIDFCHENRNFIANLHLIPLTETWKEGEFETDVTTTIEDVEQIISEAFPGEKVEYIPAGLPHRLKTAMSFFGSARLTFGGVHPNCESATIFFSDGERYWPLSRFLKRPLHELAGDTVRMAKEIDSKLEKLDPSRWFQRQRGRLLVARTLGRLWLRAIDLKQVTKGRPFPSVMRILGSVILGKRLKDQLRKHTRFSYILGMIVLPFEEYHSVESERLKHCTAGFAFENPENGEIITIPVCAFSLFRDIERKIAEKYGTASPDARNKKAEQTAVNGTVAPE